MLNVGKTSGDGRVLLFVFGLFWHNYSAEYGYIIQATIHTKQNIRYSPNVQYL